MGQEPPGVFSDSTGRLALCVCAMTDANEGRSSSAEDSATEQSVAVSAVPAAPMSAPSEASSSGASSSPASDEMSGLLKKIKDLLETQKALKADKKRCALEIKNAVKRICVFS